MVKPRSRVAAVMLAFLFGFATIGAEELPEGVMPKRQVVGTGVTSSNTPSTSPNSPSTSQGQTSNTGGGTTQSNSPSTNGNGNGGTTSDTSNNNNNGGTTSQSADTTQKQGSTSIPTTVAITTTNANGDTVTSHVSTNTLAPKSTKNSAIVTSTNSKGNNVVKVGSKTVNPSTLSHKTTIRQPLVTHETKHSTYTSFWTSNGQVYSSVVTTENVFASTTGYATATVAPGLANDGGSGSNLSTNTKKIIGGVVGGIGGALLIGGLAFVFWRLYGKKKAGQGQEEYYDGSQTDSIANHKRQSTGVLSNSAYSDGGNANAGLERYQNPARINTSSNF